MTEHNPTDADRPEEMTHEIRVAGTSLLRGSLDTLVPIFNNLGGAVRTTEHYLEIMGEVFLKDRRGVLPGMPLEIGGVGGLTLATARVHGPMEFPASVGLLRVVEGMRSC